MSVEIVVRFLEENLYAEHFINYYLQLGFDHIHILFEKNQKPFTIKNEKVSVIVHDYVGNHVLTQIPTLLTLTAKWVFFCDADEYLYLNTVPTIQEFLATVPEDVDQLFFQWAMIEHFTHITGKHDLFEILSTNKLYANPHVKAMIRYDRLVYHIDTPHNFRNTNKNYLWNQYVENTPVQGIQVSNYINGTYPFLIHFHTRSLQNVFVKGLLTNFVHTNKNINVNTLESLLIDTNIEEIRKIKKVKLPFAHSQYPVIPRELSLKGSLIDFDLETTQLQEICDNKGVTFELLLTAIKELDGKYSSFFKKA